MSEKGNKNKNLHGETCAIARNLPSISMHNVVLRVSDSKYHRTSLHPAVSQAVHAKITQSIRPQT